MLDIQLAVAKQRGLDLIQEASAERVAARFLRQRAIARRERAARPEIGCARASAGQSRLA